MKKEIYVALVIFVTSVLFCGCNILPKSIQYQKEEEDVIGSVDTMNPRVEEIQVVLHSLGYYIENIDGRMDQKTREAIKSFQESKGIKSTGYVNMNTWHQIEDIMRANEESELKDSYKIEVKSAYKGEKGEFRVTTKEIQIALKNAGFDPGAIDGKMGPRTQQAVKEFQRAKGLKIDGKVGPKTWAELGKYLER